MEYREDFKQKVLEVYNNDEKIKEMLDNGIDYVGTIFYNDANEKFTCDDIITAYQNKDFKSLYLEAKKRLEKLKLFYEWQQLYKVKQEEYFKNL